MGVWDYGIMGLCSVVDAPAVAIPSSTASISAIPIVGASSTTILIMCTIIILNIRIITSIIASLIIMNITININSDNLAATRSGCPSRFNG